MSRESTKMANRRTKSERFRDKMMEREARFRKGNQDADIDMWNRYSWVQEGDTYVIIIDWKGAYVQEVSGTLVSCLIEIVIIIS